MINEQLLQDDAPRRERWIEFTVRITLRHNLGSFGITYERLGEFRFCAQSHSDAVAIAGPFTAGATHSIDTTKLVEVVGSVPVPWEEVELARCQRGVAQNDMSNPELSSWINELEVELV